MKKEVLAILKLKKYQDEEIQLFIFNYGYTTVKKLRRTFGMSLYDILKLDEVIILGFSLEDDEHKYIDIKINYIKQYVQFCN